MQNLNKHGQIVKFVVDLWGMLDINNSRDEIVRK